LKIAQQTTDTIHLLLTDVVMPGINGRVLADEMKKRRPGIKVVYMSGYTGQRIGETIIEPGSLYLQKPFMRENLARKVREALDVASVAPVA
jgi:two-component system cell cycle sensor histidine kinase/response regulator CckA